MTTEQESQGQQVSKEQWHVGPKENWHAGSTSEEWNSKDWLARWEVDGRNTWKKWDETVKAAVDYTESKQEGKKLPVTCINDFADILSLYVTSGELTPGELMRCFTLAVEAELKVQQQTIGALTDVLELLGE
jgi:hypothetical protein